MEQKRWKKILLLFVEAFKESVRDQYQNIAASLAYYLFLSLAPLVGFSIFLSNKILGNERTLEEVIPFLKNYFSPQFVQLIIFFLQKNKQIGSDGIASLSVLTGLVLAYSTKEYFGMVKDAVELTWNKRGDQFGILHFFKRLGEDLSVAFFTLAIIFLFLAVGTIWPDKADYTGTMSFPTKLTYDISSLLFQFLLFFILFFFCFFLLPPVKVYWRNALVPGVVASVLQVTGREIMNAHAMNYPDAGLAESFLVVLIWFYYSGVVFIYAAEFAKVYISFKQNIDFEHLQFSR